MAMKAGINYFDTAYTYQDGDSERLVGEALSKYPRDSYYLSTKFYEASGKPIEEVFEEQLRRCQTDYFDFYMLHSMDEGFIDAYMDEEKGYLKYLLEQKKQARIRYLGFSSHAAPETLRRFLEWYSDFDMALIQVNYVDWSLLDAKRQYDILTEYKIPVWVMEPLKGGRLASLNDEAAAILKEALPQQSVSSWGFRFLMGLPNVQTILSGISSPEQIADNLKTFSQEQPLNDEEKGILKKARDVFMNEMGIPCSSCRYCCSICPNHLDIPLLIQGYNEKRISGATWKITALEKAKGPENCIQCGQCLKYCPQKIDIPRVMNEFKELMK